MLVVLRRQASRDRQKKNKHITNLNRICLIAKSYQNREQTHDLTSIPMII